MALTDTRAIVDAPKTRDGINTAEAAVLSGAHAAMMRDVNSSMLGAGDNALAGFLSAKAAPAVIQGESFVIPPAPYPKADQYTASAKASADTLIDNV
jgi:hypothetical protein